MAEFYPHKVNADPSYWEELYKEALLDADALLKGRRNVAACFHCHAAIEKALKWALAKEGKLDPDKDDKHILTPLAMRIGIYETLKPEERSLFVALDNLHSDASYPSDMVKYRAMEEKGFTDMVVRNTRLIIEMIVEWEKPDGESGNEQ